MKTAEPKTKKIVMVVGEQHRVLGFSSGSEPTYADVLKRAGYRVINPKDVEQALKIIDGGQPLDLIITGWEESSGLLWYSNRLQSGSTKNYHGTQYVITGKADADSQIVDEIRAFLREEGIGFTYLPQTSADSLLNIVNQLTNKQQPVSIERCI